MSVVYYALTDDLDVGALRDAWTGSLTPDETDRLTALRLERDQRDYLAAHVLLRICLQRERGTELAAPPPSNRTGWSLTHSEGLVACALASDEARSIGVDAEPLEAAARLETLGETFLTGSEMALLPNDPDGRARRMVEIWTEKEAVLKARGEGFGGEQGFGVLDMLESTPLGTLDGWRTISIRDARSGDAYSARGRWVENHALTVVVEGDEGIPRLEGVTLL